MNKNVLNILVMYTISFNVCKLKFFENFKLVSKFFYLFKLTKC